MARAPKPGTPAANDVLDSVIELRVPHHLMRRKNFRLVFDAVALCFVGGFVLTIGRALVPAAPNDLLTNLIATGACYAFMFVAGVVGIMASPNTTIREDTAKFTTLVYFMFLATIVIYGIACIGVYFAAGDTLVNILRDVFSPFVTRLLVCFPASLLAIGLIAQRTRRFYFAPWTRAQHKPAWIAVYWVLTSVTAAVVLTYPQGG
ncbi:hypothetical protein [Rhizobium sp. Root1220]|uniref:hypothetical protein n=1 Tax=Rhizobium sp. Root1220 TaxID=1736432 RepID=UPI0006FA584E|nr:hypothetical protein [Rhizobium sp. Root1220]KQV82025.1 hypothetical protein ASC90_24240 [Rhizobium sp. Root1220]